MITQCRVGFSEKHQRNKAKAIEENVQEEKEEEEKEVALPVLYFLAT